eukprot:255136-Pyramimonas_sp.AAC.1
MHYAQGAMQPTQQSIHHAKCTTRRGMHSGNALAAARYAPLRILRVKDTTLNALRRTHYGQYAPAGR